MDIRTAKVDNGWIIFSMSVGLFVCIWQKNITGIGFFIMGSVMPLFLMILFAFGMIGAGDIKLFCALGGIMGCKSIIKCIFISFLTGAWYSFCEVHYSRVYVTVQFVLSNTTSHSIFRDSSVWTGNKFINILEIRQKIGLDKWIVRSYNNTHQSSSGDSIPSVRRLIPLLFF